ncbi:SHOCT domain-containing protein [Paradesulfitobacterium aromaticivorans]
METLVKPVLSVKYEIARQIILSLLQKGLISKAEFDATG